MDALNSLTFNTLLSSFKYFYVHGFLTLITAVYSYPVVKSKLKYELFINLCLTAHRNSWKEDKNLHIKHHGIVASLSHIFYINFMAPIQPLRVLTYPDHKWHLIQHRTIPGYSCRLFAEAIFTAPQNIEQICPCPPPAPSSFPSVTLPACVLWADAKDHDGKHCKQNSSAASTLHTQVLGLLFSPLPSPVALAAQGRAKPSVISPKQCWLNADTAITHSAHTPL